MKIFQYNSTFLDKMGGCGEGTKLAVCFPIHRVKLGVKTTWQDRIKMFVCKNSI